MAAARRAVPIVLAAALFGVLVAVVKGQDTGWRDAAGNTSAPWVLVPFLAGMRCRRPAVGALAGVGATLVAFAGFYVAEAVVLDLGPHPWYVDLRLTAGTFNVYERWGLVSGSVYGALGALWAARGWLAAPVAVGLAFATEPLIVLALTRTGVWGGGELLAHPALWIGEVLIGGAVAAALVLRGRQARMAAAP